MNAKEVEKRVLKGYKIRPAVYNKAMRRAKKEKLALATLIEGWVRNYGNGFSFFNDSNCK